MWSGRVDGGGVREELLIMSKYLENRGSLKYI